MISAVLFVVIASCFLVMLYKLMSFWFVEVLVVLFCIGGVEVCLSLCVYFFPFGVQVLHVTQAQVTETQFSCYFPLKGKKVENKIFPHILKHLTDNWKLYNKVYAT